MSMTHEQFAANQARPLPAVADVDLTGKVAIVTGCNSGIGYEIVRWYLSHGITHVVAANRNETKTRTAIEALLRDTKRESSSISFAALDLSSLSSVEAFAESFLKSSSKLHILNSNAGTTRLPKTLTADGFETVAQVNHIALSYLALLLHPALHATAQADNCLTRSVITGSTGAFWVPFPEATSQRPVYDFAITKEFEGETDMRTHYFTTALLNEMFGLEYARRIAAQPVLIATTSPGLVETDFNRKDRDGAIVDAAFTRDQLGFYVRTPEEGARTAVQAAVATGTPWAERSTAASQPPLDAAYANAGRNFIRLDNMEPAPLPPLCQDAELIRRVWNDTMAVLGADRLARLDSIFTHP